MGTVFGGRDGVLFKKFVKYFHGSIILRKNAKDTEYFCLNLGFFFFIYLIFLFRYGKISKIIILKGRRDAV